jgi:hypothetical protein
MARNLLTTFTVMGALAVPTVASACLSLDIDGSIAAITEAAQKTTIGPTDRDKVASLLARARTARSSGHSIELDQALMEAAGIVQVGLLIGPSFGQSFFGPSWASRPTRQDQDADLREGAEGAVARINATLPAAALSGADLAKVADLRRQADEFVASRDWPKAIKAGTEALKILGVDYTYPRPAPAAC